MYLDLGHKDHHRDCDCGEDCEEEDHHHHRDHENEKTIESEIEIRYVQRSPDFDWGPTTDIDMAMAWNPILLEIDFD